MQDHMVLIAMKLVDIVATLCFHIDGLCMNGCEVGYSGSMCKSGMYLDIGLMNRWMDI